MKYDPEEILKCLCFVILGYFVAMMFSRMCSCGNGYRNGFRVGGEQRIRCDTNKPPGTSFEWSTAQHTDYQQDCFNMKDKNGHKFCDWHFSQSGAQSCEHERNYDPAARDLTEAEREAQFSEPIEKPLYLID